MHCFLCGGSDNLTNFSKETYKKCCDIISFRKKKNFKFGDIVLLEEPDKDQGYHSACFKKLTLLKRKHREEFERMTANLNVSI